MKLVREQLLPSRRITEQKGRRTLLHAPTTAFESIHSCDTHMLLVKLQVDNASMARRFLLRTGVSSSYSTKRTSTSPLPRFPLTRRSGPPRAARDERPNLNPGGGTWFKDSDPPLVIHDARPRTGRDGEDGGGRGAKGVGRRSRLLAPHIFPSPSSRPIDNGDLRRPRGFGGEGVEVDLENTWYDSTGDRSCSNYRHGHGSLPSPSPILHDGVPFSTPSAALPSSPGYRTCLSLEVRGTCVTSSRPAAHQGSSDRRLCATLLDQLASRI